MLTLLFSENPPLYCPHPFFRFCPAPTHFPVTFKPHPTVLSVALFLWLNGWSCHIWCTILLNGNMDLHMSGLGTRRTSMCFMQQGIKFTAVWHIMCFFTGTLIWYHTHTNTQTHTAHLGASRLTQPHKYIFPPPVMCSEQLPLLHSMIKWITRWYQKFSFHDVFSFQKLFTCKSQISVD